MEPLTRAAERSLVRFARSLYFPETGAFTPGEKLALDRGLAGKGAARPLFAALLPILSRGTWRFLVRNGGYRKIDAIVSGRKRSGRIWEEGIWPAPLRFSGTTLGWLGAAHDAGPPGSSSAPTAADRLALAAGLAGVAVSEERWNELPPELRGLVAGNPLLGLRQTRALPFPEETHWDLSEEESVALQYLADWLVAGWVKQESFLRRRPVAAQREIDTGMARAFAALFRLADPDRDFLLIPLARFYPALWKESGGTEAIREAMERMALAIPQQAAREEFLAGFGQVLSFGPRLDARVAAIQATAWADRSEAQKRLAEEHETQYRPVRDAVRLLARHFLREVG